VLGGPDVGARIERWLSELRTTDAVAERTRARWLRAAADQSATFAGVLVDLAERGAPVVVHGHAGRRHRGVLAVVGEDFCAVHTDTGVDVLVAFRGISSVRSEPGAVDTTGDRVTDATVGLAEMLAIVAPERPRVLVVTMTSSDGIAGELRSVGRDVATVRLDGPARTSAYVPLTSIAEVVLA
jgi:hypothetical protein